MVGNHDGRDKAHWDPGTMFEHQGPVSYTLRLHNGTVNIHVDHICACDDRDSALPPIGESVTSVIADVGPSLPPESPAMASDESITSAQVIFLPSTET